MSDEGVPFDVVSDQLDGLAVVTVSGEVDLTTSDSLQRSIERMTSPTVVLDLSRVAFLDSSGIRAIDRSRRRLVSQQRSLLIVSPPDTPSAWTLRVAGFDRDLVVESLDVVRGADSQTA
jgi:Anti-anti-sigma regulatory factor (antagonist of anti-sigma factor)